MLAKGEGEVIIDFTTSGYDALEDAEKCKKFSITAVWIKKYVSSGSSSNASSEASLGTVISESEVKIGNQVWMSTNLDTDTFQNGDPIPQAQNDDEWKLAGEKKQPIWAYYDYDDSNGPKYGKLYNWYAVRDKRKIAPKGWHVASYAEWKQLVDFLGGYKVAGKKLKSSSGWSQNGSGTNDSGFSAVPAGIFHFYGGGQMMLEFTQWWTTTPYNTDQAQAPSLDFDNDQVIFFLPRRDYGFSVRCIKD
jgi:uncharacterized protein (TIGR02145 family)